LTQYILYIQNIPCFECCENTKVGIPKIEAKNVKNVRFEAKNIRLEVKNGLASFTTKFVNNFDAIYFVYTIHSVFQISQKYKNQNIRGACYHQNYSNYFNIKLAILIKTSNTMNKVKFNNKKGVLIGSFYLFLNLASAFSQNVVTYVVIVFVTLVLTLKRVT
jgi:hypothetical protein